MVLTHETAEKIVYRASIFTVGENLVTLTSGRVATYSTVYTDGGVCIVAVDTRGDLVLIDQRRYAAAATLRELPAGKLAKGEDPLVCAKRELKEETGYEAATWTPLGTIVTSPGFCTEVLYGFLATDLTAGSSALEDGEELTVSTHSLATIEQEIATGVIYDAKTICFITRARLLGLLP